MKTIFVCIVIGLVAMILYQKKLNLTENDQDWHDRMNNL